MPRVKKSVVVCIQGHVKSLTMPRFSKMLPRFTKKSPRDSPRARVSPAGQPRNFHCFGSLFNTLKVMNASRKNIKIRL